MTRYAGRLLNQNIESLQLVQVRSVPSVLPPNRFLRSPKLRAVAAVLSSSARPSVAAILQELRRDQVAGLKSVATLVDVCEAMTQDHWPSHCQSFIHELEESLRHWFQPASAAVREFVRKIDEDGRRWSGSTLADLSYTLRGLLQDRADEPDTSPRPTRVQCASEAHCLSVCIQAAVHVARTHGCFDVAASALCTPLNEQMRLILSSAWYGDALGGRSKDGLPAPDAAFACGSENMQPTEQEKVPAAAGGPQLGWRSGFQGGSVGGMSGKEKEPLPLPLPLARGFGGFGGGFGGHAASLALPPSFGGRNALQKHDKSNSTSASHDSAFPAAPAPFVEGVLSALQAIHPAMPAIGSQNSGDVMGADASYHPLGQQMPRLLSLLDGATMAMAAAGAVAAASAGIGTPTFDTLGNRDRDRDRDRIKIERQRTRTQSQWEVPRHRIAVQRTNPCLSFIASLGRSGCFLEPAPALDVSFFGTSLEKGTGAGAGAMQEATRGFEAGEGHGLRKELFALVGEWMVSEGEPWEDLTLHGITGSEGVARLTGTWKEVSMEGSISPNASIFSATGDEEGAGAYGGDRGTGTGAGAGTGANTGLCLGSRSRTPGVLGRVRLIRRRNRDRDGPGRGHGYGHGHECDPPEIMFQAEVLRVHFADSDEGENQGEMGSKREAVGRRAAQGVIPSGEVELHLDQMLSTNAAGLLQQHYDQVHWQFSMQRRPMLVRPSGGPALWPAAMQEAPSLSASSPVPSSSSSSSSSCSSSFDAAAPWHVFGWLLGASVVNRASPRISLARPVCRSLLAGLEAALLPALTCDADVALDPDGHGDIHMKEQFRSFWYYPLNACTAIEIDPSNAEALERIDALDAETTKAMLELEDDDDDQDEPDAKKADTPVGFAQGWCRTGFDASSAPVSSLSLKDGSTPRTRYRALSLRRMCLPGDGTPLGAMARGFATALGIAPMPMPVSERPSAEHARSDPSPARVVLACYSDEALRGFFSGGAPPPERALDEGTLSLPIQDIFRVVLDPELNECPAQVAILWDVLDPFSSSEKEAFLRFVTGVPFLPPVASEDLRLDLPGMVFGIEQHRRNLNRLPASHTCTNTLELPLYLDSWLAIERHEGRVPADASVAQLHKHVNIVSEHPRIRVKDGAPSWVRDAMAACTRRTRTKLMLSLGAGVAGGYTLDDAASRAAEQAFKGRSIITASKERGPSTDVRQQLPINRKSKVERVVSDVGVGKGNTHTFVRSEPVVLLRPTVGQGSPERHANNHVWSTFAGSSFKRQQVRPDGGTDLIGTAQRSQFDETIGARVSDPASRKVGGAVSPSRVKPSISSVQPDIQACNHIGEALQVTVSGESDAGLSRRTGVPCRSKPFNVQAILDELGDTNAIVEQN